jgi:putative spermidine/putrescine transport system substrate-binding protein
MEPTQQDAPKLSRFRPLIALCVLGAAVVFAAACMGEGGEQRQSEVIVAEFGGAYSATIREVFAGPFSEQTAYDARVVDIGDFSSAVQKIEAMVDAGQPQWDAAEVLARWAYELDAKGALQDLPTDLETELKKILRPGTVTPWGVGIASYTTLITCNRDAVARCPRTAEEFFDTANFPGRRSLEKADWLNNCALALEADGVPPSKLFPMDIPRCLGKMSEIKDEIAVFWNTADHVQQLFRDEEIDIALGPDGRMWNLVNEGLPLSLSYSGMLRQTDYFVVLRGAQNTQGAFEFLKWYATHPEAQADFAAQRVYGVPNPQADRHISPTVARQLVDFPKNRRQTTPVDYNWVRLHGDEAAKQWADFLAG